MRRRTREIALLTVLAVVAAAIVVALLSHHPRSGGVPYAGPTAFTGSVEQPSNAYPYVPPVGRPARIMMIGTSLSAGYYTTSPDHDYVNLTLQGLGQRGPVERVQAPRLAGKSGEPTTLKNFPTLPSNLDLGVIELGTNDVTLTPLDKFSVGYQKLIANFRAGSPRAALVCLGTWQSSADAYDNEIRSACTSNHGSYRGLQDLFNTPELRGPAGEQAGDQKRDGFHPNDGGHWAIAERILRAVIPSRGQPTPKPVAAP